MRRELTRRIFMACMLVFVMTVGLLLLVMNNYLGKRNLGEMKDKALYVSAMITEEGWEFLTRTEDTSQTRTTIVAPDGTVLYDSIFPADTLENHGAREEIQAALKNGVGDSERYSESLLKVTANYAVRLPDGNVVRVSMTQDTVWMLLFHMLNPMLIIVLTAVLASILLAERFSKRIMQPINRMDVENPDDRDIYDEMKPFIRRLMSQNQQIHHQMEELREEHSKQDAMRREFTANVSHELKTPLTSISGFAEIMRDGMVQEKDIPHFADNIHKEAGRLMSLVNDILKLSRLEDIDTQPRENVPLELSALCQDVIKRLSLQAAKQDISLIFEGEPVQIMGVRTTVEEIVYNVCDNAIKYGKPSGWVRVTTGTAQGKAFISVRDNGIGIPLSDQERIFERFYRVNKSHSKEVGGTGLGLSIVKHAMMLMGGEITLNSTFGEGTELTLLFMANEPVQ